MYGYVEASAKLGYAFAALSISLFLSVPYAASETPSTGGVRQLAPSGHDRAFNLGSCAGAARERATRGRALCSFKHLALSSRPVAASPGHSTSDRTRVGQLRAGDRAAGACQTIGPARLAVEQGATPPSILIEDMGEGQARLIINQRMPWQHVLKVLELLKLGEKDD